MKICNIRVTLNSTFKNIENAILMKETSCRLLNMLLKNSLSQNVGLDR